MDTKTATGIVAVGWLGHAFAGRRDRQNRKRAFRAYLSEWRARVLS